MQKIKKKKKKQKQMRCLVTGGNSTWESELNKSKVMGKPVVPKMGGVVLLWDGTNQTIIVILWSVLKPELTWKVSGHQHRGQDGSLERHEN